MSELTEVINTSTTPRDLTGGRTIVPGERAHVVLGDHEHALIEQSALRVIEEPAKAQDEPEAEIQGEQGPDIDIPASEKPARSIPKQREKR